MKLANCTKPLDWWDNSWKYFSTKLRRAHDSYT